jgi:hypothetical protein
LNFKRYSIQNIIEHKKSRSPGLVDVEPSSNGGDCGSKQVVTDFSVHGEAEQEIDVSRNL